MRNILLKLLNKLGYHISKHSGNLYPDIAETDFWNYYNQCKPYTMTSVERMYALYQSVHYVLDHQIPGDFVECGVWRGGSSMMIGFILKNRKINDRKLYLYDTFEGMPVATAEDKDFAGRSANDLMNQNQNNKNATIWCLADLNDVKHNMGLTGLNDSQIVYVKGMVEDTIPGEIHPQAIALLRLDTDWYESTKHELEQYYPIVSHHGIIIIDDYGHWKGSRKAVDEYFEGLKVKPLLQRIDYTGRLMIKL